LPHPLPRMMIQNDREGMRVPSRKLATKHTYLEAQDILEPFFGYNVEGGYGGGQGAPGG
jgi:hypothetical protein